MSRLTETNKVQQKRKRWPWVVGAALVVALVVMLIAWNVRPDITTSAPTPTPSATKSATVPSTPTSSATTPSATQTPSASPTSTPSATPTIDTSSWPKPVDCTEGTPPPEHIAYCKVAGKTQVQVFEACKAAALGTLWVNSHNPKLGVKNASLKADIETCVRGSGLEKNSLDSNILGYLDKKGNLQYILVLGHDPDAQDPSVDGSYSHAFNASGSGAGFVAFNEDKVINKIISFYQELS